MEWVEEQLEAGRSISEEFIRELHSIIVVRGRGRRGSRSSYRQDECPVVDAATNTIDYGPPRPEDVPPLMEQMIAWLRTAAAKELPGPVRSGLLAHRFVSIHPFNDGNGRTARALATAELWRSGYDMRGFLSLEEHYMADLNAYYDNLQMGLPVDFYQGRNDPDHTPWLEFFLQTMASAADALRAQATSLYAPARRSAPPWEALHRVQQQLLTRPVMRCITKRDENLKFTPNEISEWYGVSANTSRDWLERWKDDQFVAPEKAGGATDPHLQADGFLGRNGADNRS